ncbi:MAG: phosphopantothenoylcysteine decarboxylase [Chthoniobacterales bacterium]|nr:phosphopantothenoylcysteine decarboxylase [Chthoniobacterales bacterium]
MRIVVTAGPTREPIDPVRFISNRSSGKMGYALAEAALEAEHEVTLISGPTALTPPIGAEFVAITTSDELLRAVHEHVRSCDMLIMCAAVADYRPLRVETQKVQKQHGTFSLELTATPDILASLPNERSYTVVGFAAQTHDLASNAQRKLRAKNCDVIVANDVSRSDSGMESDDNEVTIFFRNGDSKTILRAPKKAIAREILKIVLAE